MATKFPFIKGLLVGMLGSYFLSGLKQDNKIPIIKIPEYSKTGEPIAIFELPDTLLDTTRVPKEDHITPNQALQATRSNQTKIGDEIEGWNSDFPPKAFIKLHRHPYPRFVFAWTDGQLERKSIEHSDQLKLKKNTFMLFAPDPQGKFHNDCNPSPDDKVKVTVLEIKPKT